MSSHKYINKHGREYFRDGMYSCADPSLKSGTIIVPLIAVLCLILLATVLKTVLILPAERFSTTMVFFTVVYLGLIVSFPLGATRRVAPRTRTVIWAVGIVLITFGIIAVSAI
jgi:hypothetical protein